MKRTKRHNFSIGLMLVIAFFVGFPSSVFAAGNSVNLTPASGKSKPGDTFVVSVDGFVGATFFIGTYNVNGSISFPANRLKVVSINDNNATFNGTSTVTPNNTNGTISFNQQAPFLQSANNQSVHLFTITFQSLSAGTAAVNFGDVQYNTGSAATTGGTYTISAPTPPPAPKPTPKPSPKPTQTPKPVASPSPTPTPTQKPSPSPSPEPTEEEVEEPVVENDGGLRVEDVVVTMTREENTISWIVNNPDAKPVLVYGTNKGDLDNEGSVTTREDGSFFVNFTDLAPGTLYYFAIKAATIDNLQGATYSGTFTTRGYPVQLTIQHNGLLLPGAKVEIDGRTFTANNSAVILTELGNGTHNATITPADSNRSYTVSFAVAKREIPDSGNPDLQNLLLNIDATGSSSGLGGSILPFIAGGIVIFLIAGIIGMFITKKRQANSVNENIDIDRDLLASNYGDPDHWRNNTPEPKLDSVAYSSSPAPPVPPQIQPTEPIGVSPSPQTAAPEAEQDTSPTLPSPSPQLVQGSQTSEPVPVAQNEQQPVAIEQEASPQTDSAYSEEEQYSPDIVRIEASEEPEAIYNSENGQLDIIHHKSPKSTAHVSVLDNPSGNSDHSKNSYTNQPPAAVAL